jgi:hypothetical protein
VYPFDQVSEQEKNDARTEYQHECTRASRVKQPGQDARSHWLLVDVQVGNLPPLA